MAVLSSPEIQKKKGAEIELRKMVEFKELIERGFDQDGINHLGRISHSSVDSELCSAEYWLYPCMFPENCSTLSLKAQAAKCIPIIIPSGGLYETVPEAIRTDLRMYARINEINEEVKQKCVNQWAEKTIETISQPVSNYQNMLERSQNRVFIENNYYSIANKLINLIYGY